MLKSLISLVIITLLGLMPSLSLAQSAPKGDFINHFKDSATGKYLIQPYDELTYIEKDQDGKVVQTLAKIPVLPNGNITLPGYPELAIQNMTIEEFEDSLPASNKNIELVLAYHQRHHVSVIGAVNKPGNYSVKDLMSVYDAIGSAGGFHLLANKRKVKIIRQRPDGTRHSFYINFPREVFKAYENGIGKEKYLLQENDIIWVPRSYIKSSLAFVADITRFAALGAISALITIMVTPD